jgi:lipopolysaccharide transport system ATP-binding protein
MGMRKHEITRRLDEIVDFAGVERYLDTPVKRYSSGMYVRLGFAVAAHLENEILIVDEVLAVGDAEFQKKCLGKLGDVSKKEGRTVLFVSHNMQSISTLTSKAILLSEGRLYANGNTSEILDMYSHFSRTNDLTYTSSQDNSNPHIKSVELITTYPNNVQKNGDLMKVVVVLYTPFPIKNACFAFHFVNVMDIHQTNCWVFDSDQPFCRESGYTTLICEIPSLKLFMGKFYLKCYFSEPLGGRIFSIVDNICPFEVTMFNISRTEFPWHPDECTYIEKFNWTIQ